MNLAILLLLIVISKAVKFNFVKPDLSLLCKNQDTQLVFLVNLVMVRTEDIRKKRKREIICPCYRKACRRKFANNELTPSSTVSRHKRGGFVDFVSSGEDSDESSNSNVEADAAEEDSDAAEQDVEVDAEVGAEEVAAEEDVEVDAVLEGATGETDSESDQTDEEERERQEQQAQVALESIDKALHLRNYARELLAMVGNNKVNQTAIEQCCKV